MPYIAVKSFPKDSETKKRVADKINQIFLDEWGCPPEAISISIEKFAPDRWNDEVVEKQIKPNTDKMMILDGKKL